VHLEMEITVHLVTILPATMNSEYLLPYLKKHVVVLYLESVK
jgi:hypothetical protein